MTYIYDLFINLNNEYYEFFEWNKKDIIIHVKKMPLVKIDTFFLKAIIKNKVTLEKKFVDKYLKKAELYNSNTKKNYVVFSDSKTVCVVNFDDNGNILQKSSLIFEDEENVLKNTYKEKKSNFLFSITKTSTCDKLTRNEKDKKNFLIKNIKNISLNKLKFLYYDCFNKKSDNKNLIKEKILIEIENNNQDIWAKCFNLFSLIYQNK